MFKSKYFIVALTFLIITAILHLSAINWQWYYKFAYIDTLIHFAAGISVGFAFLFAFEKWFKLPEISRIKLFIIAIVSVFAVGIIWEIFEYSCDLSFSWARNYPIDTALDLLADMCGGTIAFIFSKENV